MFSKKCINIISGILSVILIAPLSQPAFAGSLENNTNSTYIQETVTSPTEYLYEHNILAGYSDSNTAMNLESIATRAMLWNMLAKSYGITENIEGEWYDNAKEWVVKEKISDGSEPNGSLTYDQAIAMLYRDAARNGKVLDEQNVYSSNSTNENYITYSHTRLNWAVMNDLIDSDTVDLTTPITRSQLIELLYNYITQYQSYVTYKEFAEELCCLYSVDTYESCNNVNIALYEGLISIYDIKFSGISLEKAYLCKIPNSVVLETLVQLGDLLDSDFNKYEANEDFLEECLEIAAKYGIDINEIDSNGYSDLETIKNWIDILLYDNNYLLCEQRNLNQFFSYESVYSTDYLSDNISINMSITLSALDTLPDYIFNAFIQDGTLTLTDSPNRYTTNDYSSSLNGLCVYCSDGNTNLYVKTGMSEFTYLHEFGHYVSALLSNRFADSDPMTIAMNEAYNVEGTNYAKNVRAYGGTNYREYFADMFAHAILSDNAIKEKYKSNYPLMYDLVMWSLDEANW